MNFKELITIRSVTLLQFYPYSTFKKRERKKDRKKKREGGKKGEREGEALRMNVFNPMNVLSGF